MAYDEGLAHRIEEDLQARGIEPVEKKMFGGVAFMVNGNMCVGVLGEGIMARVGKDAYEASLERPHTSKTTGKMKPMKGYIWVDSEGTADDAELADWIQRALSFVLTLPAK